MSSVDELLPVMKPFRYHETPDVTITGQPEVLVTSPVNSNKTAVLQQ